MKSIIYTLLFIVLSTSVFATQNKKTLTLRLQGPNGQLDDATIYFDEGISPLYNIHEDAAMVFDTVPGVPELYSFTKDNIACSINGCGTLSTAAQVRLGYLVRFNGLYTLSAVLLDNFDPTAIIRLWDNKSGTTVDLRENFYQVQLDSSDLGTGRFTILVSTPVQYASQNSDCTNKNGSIAVSTDTSVLWTKCQLFDSTNQLLLTDSNVRGILTFYFLSAGSYNVVFTYNQYSTSHNIYLEGDYVVAAIGAPSQKIYTNEDIVFNGLATNANQFEWNFGDGTLINGVDNPDQTYLLPGVYTVQFTCSNSLGCSASATASVTVYLATGVNNMNKNDNITLITRGKTLTVNMNNNVLSHNAQMTVYNLLGQIMRSAPITSQIETFNLDNGADGYYLVSINNAGVINTRRVFLQ